EATPVRAGGRAVSSLWRRSPVWVLRYSAVEAERAVQTAPFPLTVGGVAARHPSRQRRQRSWSADGPHPLLAAWEEHSCRASLSRPDTDTRHRVSCKPPTVAIGEMTSRHPSRRYCRTIPSRHA